LLDDGLVLRHSGDIAGADISPMLAWPRDCAALQNENAAVTNLAAQVLQTKRQLRDGSTTDPQGSNL
jgi:hypothetical protein